MTPYVIILAVILYPAGAVGTTVLQLRWWRELYDKVDPDTVVMFSFFALLWPISLFAVTMSLLPDVHAHRRDKRLLERINSSYQRPRLADSLTTRRG